MHAALLTLALALGASDAKPTMAVLYFDNNTKNADLDVMRKGLADMMVTDLVSWDGVTVVERDKFEAVVAELKLQRTKYFDQATAVKIGKFLEARYLLTGSMTLSGDKLILDAKLLDATKNSIVVTARADGPKDDIFEIEQQLVDRVTVGIDIKVKNEAGRRRAKVPSLEALLAYSKAMDLSDNGKVEEAQKAFAALVSKSPTFLMARERKEQAVKALEEYNKRKKEIITESALRVAKAADDTLKNEAKFDQLSTPEQARFLAMRRVKAHFLARVLRQYVSSRESSLRVVLTSKRQQAIEAMRSWHSNQLRYLDELRLHSKGSSNFSPSDATIAPELLNDITDSGLGPANIVSADQALNELSQFVFGGRIVSGVDAKGDRSDYTVAPTWADLSPADAKALWKTFDDRIAAAMKTAAEASAAQRDSTARAAASLIEDKAEILERLHRDDDAVAAFQLILDTYPTDGRNSWREGQIKKLIGGAHDFERDVRERYAKGLKSCEDMDLRVGASRVCDDQVRHEGLEGMDRFWDNLVKTCPATAKTRSVLAYVAKDIAMDSARYDDCERAKTYWRRYVELNGSISDMLGYHKNYTPWCEFGDVTANVLWMKFVMDRGWTPEVDENLVSVKSYDGKQLAISGHNKTSSIDLSLYLVPEGKSWKCRDATWRTRDGDQVTGSCTAKISREAKDKGDFDEGTFEATFTFQQDGHGLKTELTKGEFRVRRQ
ncbi:MAG: CsgG/HfaB family protein [Myxococcales bacterium]|nr:CsgG/HfaB family protein [Myxococcales bacterium]